MTSIYRPDEETVSIEELLNLATVTAEDIDEAIAQWQENPPDKGFVELLEAEET